MTSEQFREVPESERDEEALEEWERPSAEPQITGVYATKVSLTGWSWQVSFAVLEFVGDDALESELTTAIVDALSAVVGVGEVAREDREVFVVKGTPSGQDLLEAASRVVDRMSDRLREHFDTKAAGPHHIGGSPPLDEAAIRLMQEWQTRSPEAFEEAFRALGGHRGEDGTPRES